MSSKEYNLLPTKYFENYFSVSVSHCFLIFSIPVYDKQDIEVFKDDKDIACESKLLNHTWPEWILRSKSRKSAQARYAGVQYQNYLTLQIVNFHMI